MIREFQIMLLPETYAKPFKFQEESSPGGNHSLRRPGVDDTQQNAQTELSCSKRGPACWSSRPTELQQARAGVLKLTPHGRQQKASVQPLGRGVCSVLPRSPPILPTQKPLLLQGLPFGIPSGTKVTSGLPEWEHTRVWHRSPGLCIHTSWPWFAEDTLVIFPIPVSNCLFLIIYLICPSAPPAHYNLCHHPKPNSSFSTEQCESPEFGRAGGERR